jgi:hypothetical protein
VLVRVAMRRRTLEYMEIFRYNPPNGAVRDVDLIVR